VNWLSKVVVSFNSDEFKLIDDSVLVSLLPGVNEVKDAVIGPNARTNLLVDTDPFWRTLSLLEFLRSLIELTVLSESPRWKYPWLINHLRIRTGGRFWLVVTFIDQCCPPIFEAISIRSVRAN